METEIFKILRYFPSKVAVGIADFIKDIGDDVKYISEIRLRADAPMSLSYKGKNIVHFHGEYIVCNRVDLGKILQKLCEDSVHTYSETLKEGYMTLENGCRIGVCGSAGREQDGIRGVYGITSLCIRISHAVRCITETLIPLIRNGNMLQSALLYSVPNVGKTTAIRDLAASLSMGKEGKRIAIVDTRGEIYMKPMFENCLVDVLRGYPRAKGIEIATRTLSPDAIVCDEIGSEEEAKAILLSRNSGVPLLATAHAETYRSLCGRPYIKMLMEEGIFRYAIGLRRQPSSDTFTFSVHDCRTTADIVT